MAKRATPEAGLQRQVVSVLRRILPPGSIVHHSPQEAAGGGRRGFVRQQMLRPMGLHPGWPDLVVMAGGRVVFLELKSAKGRLSETQREFLRLAQEQGHVCAVCRSLDEVTTALERAGVATRGRPT